MKLPRRRLELGFINISVLSWLCFWEFKAKVVALEAKGFDTTHYELLLFYFRIVFGVAAKCPPFYTDIRIFSLTAICKNVTHTRLTPHSLR